MIKRVKIRLHILQVFLVLLTLLFANKLWGQTNDTLYSPYDTIVVDKQEATTVKDTSLNDTLAQKKHSPTKAAIFSAVLPGLGQIYNHKYWKVPIVYAGFAGLIYAISYNHDKYLFYKEAYTLYGALPPLDAYGGPASEEELLFYRDEFRRNRDLSVIVTTLWYLANIIDASVDAHLHYFDVSDDLSLHIEPVYLPNIYGSRHCLGIGLQLRF